MTIERQLIQHQSMNRLSRSLILAACEPATDSQLQWVIEQCARLARTDVLCYTNDTRFPTYEYDDVVYIERLTVRSALSKTQLGIFLASRLLLRKLMRYRSVGVVAPIVGMLRLVKPSSESFTERIRGMYDRNSAGVAAPHTDFTSKTQARHLLRDFSDVNIDVQNFDSYSLLRGKIFIRRENLLNNVAKIMGLDLYITARK